MIKLKNYLIVVEDIERSKAFYWTMFDLFVVKDFGENVILSSGLVLQEKKTWEGLLGERAVVGNMTELFFEESNFDAFLEKMEHENIKVVSEMLENSWGKRCIRIADPDGHLIEIAESGNI